MESIELVIKKIIKEQSQIIGPLAIELASKSKSISIPNNEIDSLKVLGDPKLALKDIMNTYSKLFGQVSLDVCISAARDSGISLNELEI